MKNKTITLVAGIALLCFPFSGQSDAQSGGKAGSGSRGGGGSVRSSGGARSFGGARRSTSGRNAAASAAQRAAIQQQQIAQAQALAKLSAQRQQEQSAETRANILAEIKSNPDGAVNRKFQKQAYAEAKQQYVALRKNDITVAEASAFLQTPLRLRKNEFNRQTGKVKWPKALKEETYAEAVEKLDEILADDPRAQEEATAFNENLNSLSAQLAQSVSGQEISSSDYGRSKRFLTGLHVEFAP